MSFLRHGEIYHFDEGAIPQDHALTHRNDEFPAGYSLGRRGDRSRRACRRFTSRRPACKKGLSRYNAIPANG